MVVNILGTEYTVNLVTEQAEPRLEGCDGFCDETTKEASREKRVGWKYRRRKISGMRLFTHFCSRAVWPRTASGRRMRKWLIGLLVKLRRFMRPFERQERFEVMFYGLS